MSNWNCLPMEMRVEIIKRLEFRTRFRFRHVSKSSQQLVDATPLYIPRINFLVNSATEAKLTIYTGINHRIDVDFGRIGRDETRCKVTEVTSTKVTQHGAIRRLDTPNTPMLATMAFRTVAMSRKTLLGALELNTNGHIGFSSFGRAERFFGGRKIRTKVFYMNRGESGFWLKHFAREDIEEIRSLYSEAHKNVMITYTKRLRARVRRQDMDRWAILNGPPCWLQVYVLTSDERIRRIFSPDNVTNVRSQPIVQINGDNDVTLFRENEGVAYYTRINSCGAMSWIPFGVVKIEGPLTCQMRWACRVHADPFDQWYNTKKTKLKDTTPYHSLGLNDAVGFTELVYPVINGRCQVTKVLDRWALEYELVRESERKKDEEAEEEGDGGRKVRIEEEIERKIDSLWLILMAFGCLSVVFGVILQWFQLV